MFNKPAAERGTSDREAQNRIGDHDECSAVM